jgi:TolB-like protein
MNDKNVIAADNGQKPTEQKTGKDADFSNVDAKTTLTNQAHPGHDLYKNILSGIERLPGINFVSNDEKQNVAAALTFEAAKAGLRTVNHVVLSADASQIFAVGGSVSSASHLRVHLSINQAASHAQEKTALMWYEEFANDKKKRISIQDEIIQRNELERQQQSSF